MKIDNKWLWFTVELTLNNGESATYKSQMISIDYGKAKQLAVNNNWESGIKTIDNVVFK